MFDLIDERALSANEADMFVKYIIGEGAAELPNPQVTHSTILLYLSYSFLSMYISLCLSIYLTYSLSLYLSYNIYLIISVYLSISIYPPTYISLQYINPSLQLLLSLTFFLLPVRSFLSLFPYIQLTLLPTLLKLQSQHSWMLILI